MSDHDSKLTGYHKPTEAELKARKARSYAIAAVLIAFVVLIFMLMLTRMGGA